MSTSNASQPALILANAITSQPIVHLLQQRIPGGVPVPSNGDLAAAVSMTAQYITDGKEIIYNAAFAFNGVVSIIDVLVMHKGRWFASLFRPSTRIKETHLVDAALGETILRRSGLTQVEMCLLLLNTGYVRQGALSSQQLFIEERVSRRLQPHYPAIHGRMAMVRRIAAQKAKREKQALTIPANAAEKKNSSVTLQAAELEVEREPLAAFLASLQYPMHFMDFEAYQTAVPEWDGHWPFRQIPFQFSVHRQDESGSGLHHEGFIIPSRIEPTAAFGAALLKAMGEKGTVLVYNIDSERLILNQLQKSHPHLSEPIMALQERLVDLMTPFSKGFIRIPSIGNKLSLKYILPALVPEMSYAALAIGDGKDVNEAYNAIRRSNDTELIETTRAALLAYCEVDTLAMVRILEKMRTLV